MKPKNKRCKFYQACGQQATHRAYHTFLKRDLDVCDRCANTNEYLEPIACEGDEVTILGADGKVREGVWQGIIAEMQGTRIDVLTRVGRESLTREQVLVVGKAV